MEKFVKSLSIIFIIFSYHLISQPYTPQPTPTFSGGSGTETDPYLISNINDIDTLRYYVNEVVTYVGGAAPIPLNSPPSMVINWTSCKHFRLTNDINDSIRKPIGGMRGKYVYKSFYGNGDYLCSYDSTILMSDTMKSVLFRVFKGYFHGGGHKLTLAIRDDTNCIGGYLALFPCVLLPGNIDSLIVDGYVKADSNYRIVSSICGGSIFYGSDISGSDIPPTPKYTVLFTFYDSLGYPYRATLPAPSYLRSATVTNCINAADVSSSNSPVGIICGESYHGDVPYPYGNPLFINAVLPSSYDVRAAKNCTNIGTTIGKQYHINYTLCATMNSGYITSLDTSANNTSHTFLSRKNDNIPSYIDVQMMCKRNFKHSLKYSQRTEALVGSGLSSILGGSDWVYEPRLYPRLKMFSEHPASYVAAAPIFLKTIDSLNFDNRMRITDNFVVSTKNGVQWTARQGKVSFNDSIATFVMPGLDTLEAYIGTYKKIIPINLVCSLSLRSSHPNITTLKGAGIYDSNAIDKVPIQVICTNKCYKFINWTDSATGEIVSIKQRDTIKLNKLRQTLIANYMIDTFELKVVSPQNIGTVTGNCKLTCADSAVISATTDGITCCKFLRWEDFHTKRLISLDSIHTVSIDSNTTLAAMFELEESKIILHSRPPTGGYTSGAGLYLCNNPVSISAAPKPNYHFKDWTDSISNELFTDQIDTTFNIKKDYTVLYANFIPDTFNVNISINVSNVAKFSGDGQHAYETDADISTTLTDTCYEFVNWTANGIMISTEKDFRLTVLSDTNIVANYKARAYKVTLSSNPPEAGELTGDGKFGCPLVGTQIVANPKSNFRFVNWTYKSSGKLFSSRPSVSFLVYKDFDLVANFVSKSADIAVVDLFSDPENGGTLTGAGAYKKGEKVEISAEMNTGFNFEHWTNPLGEIVSTVPNYSFVIDRDTSFTAKFYKSSYLLNIVANPLYMGKITGTTSGMYPYKYQAVVTATPTDSNYVFVNWTEGDDIVAQTPVYEFLVLKDASLVANFKPRSFISDYIDVSTIRILPNPAAHQFVLSFNILSASHIKINMTDIAGKELILIFDEYTADSNFSKLIKTNNIAKGSYYINIKINDDYKTEKIIIE